MDNTPTLYHIVSIILDRLRELYDCNAYNYDFVHGQKTAYVECLEIIQLYDKSSPPMLPFDIEEKFPI
ncbi:MAG: hypothetical protein IJD07_02485 [Clostridia bacterium]|nr:hypothetical protein [Clostridia bacterium]